MSDATTGATTGATAAATIYRDLREMWRTTRDDAHDAISMYNNVREEGKADIDALKALGRYQAAIGALGILDADATDYLTHVYACETWAFNEHTYDTYVFINTTSSVSSFILEGRLAAYDALLLDLKASRLAYMSLDN